MDTINKVDNKDAKRIINVKPTDPGFLLITYSDSSQETIDVINAPGEKEIQESSPILEGASKYFCPHCSEELLDCYHFVYFSKIIKGKVYSFSTEEWEEKVVSRVCAKCSISIFEWELNELYIEYLELDSGQEGLTGILRLEPVTENPGTCPGIREIAWNTLSIESKCQGYPKCLKTGECVKDWRIKLDSSKISVSNLVNPDNLDLLRNYHNKEDV